MTERPVLIHDYLSTACGHSRCGDCRVLCKYCTAACRCDCHGIANVPYPGFSRDEEDQLRQTIREVATELGVGPGPRGRELIADILTGVFLRIDTEATR